MRAIPALILVTSIILTSLPVYAFQVKVNSTATGLEGIGFSTKGKNYGGMGKSYSKSGMSKGIYTFGVRKSGKDIGCKDESGKRNIELSGSANVTLVLKGGHCTLKMSSR